MRRFLLFKLLVLALPLTVSAKIVPLINTNGTLTGSDSGLSLTSTLTHIHFGYHDTDLGTSTISLGPVISGNLATGGTFSSSGGSIHELQGTIGGSWFYGFNATGIVTLSYYRTFNSDGVFTATIGSGTSLINPEPGTLALLGTGFVGLAAIAKLSKMRRSNSQLETGPERSDIEHVTSDG